jgi:hypothetical protein
MSILKGLWSGAKAVLGFSGSSKGSDNVMKVASGIGNFIDEQNFTEEERAKFRLTAIEHYGNYMSSTVGENTQRSITRRELAIYIIRVELAVIIFSLLMYKVDPAWAEYGYKIATESPLGLLTLGVGAFFFGTHLVRAAQGK